MKQYRKLFTYVTSSATVLGTALFLKNYTDKNTLKASWTTGHEPSVKWIYNWDKRDPSSLVKPLHKSNSENDLNKDPKDKAKSVDDFEISKHSSKATRNIFLVRHGQYEIKNKEAHRQILTELGREQADFTGKRLKELALKFKYDKIHHSTMIRAIETADIIRTHLPEDIPVNIDPLLCEGAPIPPEPPVGHWKPEFYDGGRIEAAFRKYFYRAPPEQLEDSYEVIVCHANVIRYFFCRALQFPPEAWLRFDLTHGSITHIKIRPDGRVGCRVLGESGYMPVSKVTS